MRQKILTELRSLLVQIENYHDKFGANDIRSSFLDGYFEILKNYYFAYYQLDEKETLEKYIEIYQRDYLTKDDLTNHVNNQKQGLNSTLIVNCWSNFELFITLFCYAVLPKSEIDKLLELDYEKTKQILKKESITEEIDIKLRKYVKNHLTHIPNVNKYGKILKLIRPYPSNRTKKEDLNFLEFFGQLRNCMHSNYIYYGTKEKEFVYDNEKFRFKFGKPISQSNFKESSPYNLTKNLKDIFELIVNNIDYKNEIYDPSNENN